MKTKAAVVYAVGKPFEIVELEVTPPRENEVLLRYTHSGLCHSDLHIPNGEFPARLPMVMGHEGAGVVEEVGAGVTRVKPGDHFVCSFIPSCGVCHWCATGNSNICDFGSQTLEGNLPQGRFPFLGPGPETAYGAMCGIGTFSQLATVHQTSVVKIDDDVPLDKAALVGCGVPTGWGSAVHAADVRAGDTVLVVGVGGVGVNAVQGARFAGAKYVIAADPLANKREWAVAFGATHTAGSAAEAMDVAQSLTDGRGADKVICTPGILTEEIITESIHAAGKAATIVFTGMNSPLVNNVRISSALLAMYRQTIKGSLFGDCNPFSDIPKLLGLYRTGDLMLDELITRRYNLKDVNQGYDDLLAGRNLRGVIEHDAI